MYELYVIVLWFFFYVCCSAFRSVIYQEYIFYRLILHMHEGTRLISLFHVNTNYIQMCHGFRYNFYTIDINTNNLLEICVF